MSLAVLLLAGAIEATCPVGSAAPAIAAVAAAVESPKPAVSAAASSDAHRVDLHLTPTDCATPGRALAPGELATPSEVAKDAYCAEVVASRAAPNGFVSVFGSSRTQEDAPAWSDARHFAASWAKARPSVPIATGGGPGIMGAANRGAKEAGGASLSFACNFSGEPQNPWTTDGYLFADMATRERALFQHARAAVFFAGGFGTSWELFQTLSEVQTGKLPRIPIILVGGHQWDATMALIADLKAKGTISPEDVSLVRVVDGPTDAMNVLQEQVR